ncbi:MAG: transposase [Microvirga sp.]
MDINRAFAEAVAWQEGKLKRIGRIDMRRDQLTAFAASLLSTDVVVVEATGNAAAVAAVISPHVKRVVIANPMQVRVIAHAKIKTDTIDAGVLAQLYASGFLPEVWIADEATQALRRQVTRRNQVVRQRSRLKNIIQSILHAHLIPACPVADLCGPKGRAWLSEQVLPDDERFAIERHLRAFFLRVSSRRGQHVAAVATARKLAVLIWHLLHKGESYLWARPALHAKKMRELELKAGHPAARGQKGAAHAYNLKSHRDQERRWVEQAEAAYARFVAGWNPRGPRSGKVRTGALKEERQ